MWVRKPRVHTQNVSVIWHMYTCEYMHVYQEVLSVSTQGHKYVSFFNMGSSTNVSAICYICILVSICMYQCKSRGSKCEHSQGHKHMWAFLWIEYSWRYSRVVVILNCQDGCSCSWRQWFSSHGLCRSWANGPSDNVFDGHTGKELCCTQWTYCLRSGLESTRTPHAWWPTRPTRCGPSEAPAWPSKHQSKPWEATPLQTASWRGNWRGRTAS